MSTRRQVYSYYPRKNQIERGGIEEYKFCPYCQTELIISESGGRERPTCSACGFIHYRNPAPAVCIAIVKGDQILLGKRGVPPGKGLWAIPSGYIEFEDDYLSTAIQEAKEETGLDVEIQSVFNLLSSFYSPKFHFLVIYVIAKVIGGEIAAGDDTTEVAWFPIKGPLPELAFTEDMDTLKVFADQGFEGLPISTN